MTTARAVRTPPRDVPPLNAATRGAAVAFFPLLLWGVIGPPLAGLMPAAALAEFLLLTGVVACYVLAGFRAGSVAVPTLGIHAGAGAGLVTYLLVLPVNLVAGQGLDPLGLVTSAVLAAGVGAGAGHIGRRARQQERKRST